ncbi:hypothetical protein TrRE_jg4780, partial [Triparma retinervis]
GVADYCSDGNWWVGQCEKTCCLHDPNQRKISESESPTTTVPANFETQTALSVFGAVIVLVGLVGFKMGERSRDSVVYVEAPLDIPTMGDKDDNDNEDMLPAFNAAVV